MLSAAAFAGLLETSSDVSNLCRAKSVFTLLLGSLLTLGGQVAYLPQHVGLLRSKSSAGLSWLFLLLNNVGSFALVLNALVLQWAHYQCCSTHSFSICQEQLLSFYQIAVPWVNMFVVYVLYLRYREPERVFAMSGASDDIFERIRVPDGDRMSIRVFWSYVGIIGILSIITAALMGATGPHSSSTRNFARVMGGVSTILNICCYMPQILQTYQEKGPGSLSVIMLFLQAPGNLAAAYLQGVLYDASFTTWMPFLATAAQQIILIIMCIYYMIRSKRHHDDDDDEIAGDLLLYSEDDYGKSDWEDYGNVVSP